MLFADVAGFTEVSEYLDPEDIRRLINDCFDQLVPIIEMYGGFIDKFIGDEIMALFGAPIMHEDDAIRSLQAALQMMQQMEAFNRLHSTNLSLHVGVNSGLVIAGGVGSRGRQQYSVLGDTVNLAARLEEISQAGEILVGAATYRQAAAHFEFEALPILRVKGRAGPVHAYRLLRARPNSSAVRQLRGLESSMVGRESELELLSQVSQALQEQQGHLVLILGEAGVGKSRLLWEWRQLIETRQPDVLWVTGQCVSYGRNLPYHLLADIVRKLLGIPVNISPEAALALIEQSMMASFSSTAEEMTAYLANLLALPVGERGSYLNNLDPAQLQERYLSVMQKLLEETTLHQPLVIICEDIHWIDASSSELLVNLLPLFRELPLIFCLSLRPTEEGAAIRLLNASHELKGIKVQQIELALLNSHQTQELINNFLGYKRLPIDLHRAIIEKTEGNPLFIQEVLHMLIEQGILVQDSSGWRLQVEKLEIAIPDQLQTLLLARVDQLPAKQRQLLKTASVIGHGFSLNLLLEVINSPLLNLSISHDELASILGDLERSRLLQQVRVAPEAEYQFSHIFIQSVLYNALIAEDRNVLHLAVGKAMEMLFPERQGELAGVLANHFIHTSDHNRALKYALMAADAAYERYAISESIEFYQMALKVLEGETQADIALLTHLFTRCGRALELANRYAEADQLYRRIYIWGQRLQDRKLELKALAQSATLHLTPTTFYDPASGREIILQVQALAHELGDYETEAKALWQLMLLHNNQGQADIALNYGEQALAICRQHSLTEQMAFTLEDLGTAYNNIGNRQMAFKLRQKALPLWRSLGNLPMLANNLGYLAIYHFLNGDFILAMNLSMEGYQISLQANNAWGQSFSRITWGPLFFETGEIGRSQAILEELLELSHRSGLAPSRAGNAANLAYLFRYCGDLEQSEHYLSLAKQEINHPMPLVLKNWILAAISRVEILNNHPDIAEEWLQKAQPSSNRNTYQWITPIILSLAEVELALRRKDFEKAAALAQMEIDQLTNDQVQMFTAELLYLQGLAHLALGQVNQAQQSLLTAQLSAEKLHLRRVLWQIQATRANLERSAGRSDLAEALRLMAYQTFESVAASIESSALRERFRQCWQSPLLFYPAEE